MHALIATNAHACADFSLSFLLEQVFFTSGGTESNNWAIKGAVEAALAHLPPQERNGPAFRLVMSAIEHPAVMEVMQHLKDSRGFNLRVVPVDSQGLVDADAVIAAALGNAEPQNSERLECATSANAKLQSPELRETSLDGKVEPEVSDLLADAKPQTCDGIGVVKPSTVNSEKHASFSADKSVAFVNETVHNNRETAQTLIVSIMHSNNEVGSIQPIAEIGRALRKAGAVFHTDASQSVGKVPIRWDEMEVDLLTIAGHKVRLLPRPVMILGAERPARLSLASGKPDGSSDESVLWLLEVVHFPANMLGEVK